MYSFFLTILIFDFSSFIQDSIYPKGLDVLPVLPVPKKKQPANNAGSTKALKKEPATASGKASKKPAPAPPAPRPLRASKHAAGTPRPSIAKNANVPLPRAGRKRHEPESLSPGPSAKVSRLILILLDLTPYSAF
jgi:hypothetical protein